ncbi:MAG: tyrosine-type recombinase/integrase [Limisphaerales bacterium]
MNAKQAVSKAANPDKDWQKTQYANLIRYVPSGTYYARLRVKGKLIRRSLKTDVMSVAKLRLGDFEKQERQRAESCDSVAAGKMSVGDAIEIYKRRVAGDASLKPRTREYHAQRITALLKSWPGLAKKEIRSVTKTDCLNWAAKFGSGASATAFNHTIGIFRALLEIGIEMGSRYDNPAKFIKRASERPKVLALPEPAQFERFVKEIENGGGGFSRSCANLVRFLAFGGFRKSEAANITWADCDFEKGEIIVRGDPETGTKNWTVRRVPMIPDMRKLLENLKMEQPKGADSNPVMQVRECQKAMDRASKAVGMARITHHDLRHLFATLCIESGVDIPTVSRWLGHKDGGALAMKVYGHLRDQHSVAMAQRVTFSRT